ncbi:hypothetical protein HMN09_00812600 [Mycena chlorophos]|uniref:F-box domain-containing protein n=1 Tax=Mycena chlorophos TaxID=658473 RepID=A0A8H6W4N6_MYCCL|nr:hypothetical protein HMN09_00812600 [Mycena chlorophos]
MSAEAAPKQTAPDALGLDILLEIFDLLAVPMEYHQRACDLQVLANCSLVCRAWSPPAQKLLFRRIILPHNIYTSPHLRATTRNMLPSFLSAIDPSTEKGRWLASCVLSLTLRHTGRRPSTDANLLFSALLRTTNLRHLDVTTFSCDFDAEQLDQLRTVGPALTSLSILQDFSSQAGKHAGIMHRLVAAFPTIRILEISSDLQLPPFEPRSQLSLVSLRIDAGLVWDIGPVLESLVAEGSETALEALYLRSKSGLPSHLRDVLAKYGTNLRSFGLRTRSGDADAEDYAPCTNLERFECGRFPSKHMLDAIPKHITALVIAGAPRPGSDEADGEGLQALTDALREDFTRLRTLTWALPLHAVVGAELEIVDASLKDDFVLAALDGGAAEMQALLDRILRKKITRVNLPKLFCLFHAVLDTAPIADLLERDITVPVVRAEVIQQLARVNLSIDGLDMILSKRVWADGTNAVLPTEALAEFYPRLLAWLEVWHVFAEVLHATPQELPYRLSCDTVQLHVVKMLCRNDAAKRIVFAVEHTRLYWVLGRAWILLPRVVALVPEVDLKNALHTLCWVWDQDCMEFQNGDEHGHKLLTLLEGVGGDWETLARLCVFNERTYFPTPDSFVDDGVVTVMRTPITTMIAATPGERTFQNALRRDGMVTYLVNALRSLVAGGQVGRGYRSTDLCLGAIALCLSGPHNEKVFLEAVHGHLIPAAAEYGARLRATADEQEFSESAIRFYHVVLVGYFSTYAVLKALRETPFEEDLLSARDLKFKNKHVEEAWAFFSMFSFTRMMLATEFEKGKLANAPRACDNIAASLCVTNVTLLLVTFRPPPPLVLHPPFAMFILPARVAAHPLADFNPQSSLTPRTWVVLGACSLIAALLVLALVRGLFAVASLIRRRHKAPAVSVESEKQGVTQSTPAEAAQKPQSADAALPAQARARWWNGLFAFNLKWEAFDIPRPPMTLAEALPITLHPPPAPAMRGRYVYRGGRGVGFVRPSRPEATLAARRAVETPSDALSESQTPASMAKLIMSRHTYRRPAPIAHSLSSVSEASPPHPRSLRTMVSLFPRSRSPSPPEDHDAEP